MSASRIPLVASEELTQSWRNRSQNVDAYGLENSLRQAVTGEVRFDAGSRALYATDRSNYRQVPIGVVIPKSKRAAEDGKQRRCHNDGKGRDRFYSGARFYLLLYLRQRYRHKFSHGVLSFEKKSSKPDQRASRSIAMKPPVRE
jgi:hypothetical protein